MIASLALSTPASANGLIRYAPLLQRSVTTPASLAQSVGQYPTLWKALQAEAAAGTASPVLLENLRRTYPGLNLGELPFGEAAGVLPIVEALAPHGSAANRLCAVAGDLGELASAFQHAHMVGSPMPSQLPWAQEWAAGGYEGFDQKWFTGGREASPETQAIVERLLQLTAAERAEMLRLIHEVPTPPWTVQQNLRLILYDPPAWSEFLTKISKQGADRGYLDEAMPMVLQRTPPELREQLLPMFPELYEKAPKARRNGGPGAKRTLDMVMRHWLLDAEELIASVEAGEKPLEAYSRIVTRTAHVLDPAGARGQLDGHQLLELAKVFQRELPPGTEMYFTGSLPNGRALVRPQEVPRELSDADIKFDKAVHEAHPQLGLAMQDAANAFLAERGLKISRCERCLMSRAEATALSPFAFRITNDQIELQAYGFIGHAEGERIRPTGDVQEFRSWVVAGAPE